MITFLIAFLPTLLLLAFFPAIILLLCWYFGLFSFKISRKAKIYLFAVIIVLVGTVVVGDFIFRKFYGSSSLAEKYTTATMNTLIEHDWELKSLIHSATPKYASWLVSPNAAKFSSDLNKFKSVKQVKLIEISHFNFGIEDQQSTLSFSAIIQLMDGNHRVSMRIKSSSNHKYFIDNFYLSKNTTQVEDDEIRPLIKNFLENLSHDKSAEEDFGISAKSKIIDYNQYIDRGIAFINIRVTSKPRHVDLILERNKNSLKINFIERYF